jgi:hypothetical protein
MERAVTDNHDGSYTVKGADSPEYTVDPSGCTCTDCTGGKAPGGLCKHVLAVALEKRSRQRFQALAEALVSHPSPIHESQTPLPEALGAGLPEAPISVCMKGTLAGIPGTMVTLRGNDMREIQIRADQVRAGARYLAGIFDASDTPAANAPAPAGSTAASERSDRSPKWAMREAPLCPDHQREMQPSKFGGWYCPLPTGEDGAFCKHKASAKKRATFVPQVDGGMWKEQ